MTNISANIIYSKSNIELLRKLWLDRIIINYNELGPGDPGDFDYGAWHSSCHLVAAGGVRKNTEGKMFWLEISYNSSLGLYEPTLTFRKVDKILTVELNSLTAHEYLLDSKTVGFVEGTSEGRISARGIVDRIDLFNNNPRQEYDQDPESPKEGGKVWEHWCTLRDIRDSSQIANSILSSFILLAFILGDKFSATVLRGRKEYSHPKQLCAMVQAGFISKESALIDIIPQKIPLNVAAKLKTATPSKSFDGIELLKWPDNGISYYMYERKIGSWSTSKQIAKEFADFGI